MCCGSLTLLSVMEILATVPVWMVECWIGLGWPPAPALCPALPPCPSCLPAPPSPSASAPAPSPASGARVSTISSLDLDSLDLNFDLKSAATIFWRH